ncbi:N-acetylmannosamine-6-phosphate 2-epimerase [Paenibacillus sp. GCM10027626]|uniref:N-acetylmannosamine-6-phosphate 2-epimerase n=1 Tax=Paenibacillus sp. GCM10027626 TaxID=3273411 RepID=UPI00363D11D3
MKINLAETWKKGCIVSCQALEHEPLFGSHFMAAMAAAAEEGGAVGIRANTPVDIAAIKQAVKLPVMGLYKVDYEGYDVYITPTMREIAAVIEAGADAVALDATKLPRPDGLTLEQVIGQIREQYPQVAIVADVSTFEEGVAAMDLGVDFVSTTLSGYTAHSKQQSGPDIELVAQLAELHRTPVLAEGRIWTTEDSQRCIEAGAHAVVVGTAITRPQEIARRFVQAVKESAQHGE